MKKDRRRHREVLFQFILISSSVIMFVVSLHDFLLFHALEEIFTIIISFAIFIIAWSSRRYIDNSFLFFLGVAYLFIGAADLVHMLTYEGRDMSGRYDANIAAQFWIFARYLEALSIIGAFLFLADDSKEKSAWIIKNSYRVLAIFAGIFLAAFVSIIYFEIFPQAFEKGAGATSFRIYSEYAISVLFLLAIILLFKKRERFDREMANFLSLSLMMKLLSEVAFAQYFRAYDFSNILSHIFRFISFLLLYKAVFEVGMDKPYRFMFLNLKKSEERYKSLVDFIPDPIVVHSKGGVLYANGLAKKLFGMEGKNIVGTKVVDFFLPKYKEIIQARMEKIYREEWKETPLTEMEILRPDGKVISVEVKGMKIFYEGKDAVESIIRDISERKEAEKKIRSLAQFPEESPNPIIRSSIEGEIEFINDPAKKMLACFDWKDGMRLPEPLVSAVRNVVEKNERPELELACKNDRIYFINLAPSFTDKHVNVYGRDITERKKAEKELIETQAELRARIEEQLIESYRHMGIVNRKMSLLLEVGSGAERKKNKQEVADYIVKSVTSLSGARVGMLYASLATNYLSLVSSSGLDNEKKAKISVVFSERLSFINKIFAEKRRVNSPVEFEKSGTFDGVIDVNYFVALPIMKNGNCRGFLFLGFQNRKSMDVQELEFLDVFAKHISSSLISSGLVV